MQPTMTNELLQDREEAGFLLSRRLAEYKDSNAVVVGIPHGGVLVASVIADELSLFLEAMPCRKIKHPANRKQNVGSVSEDDVFIHDCSHTIPQDYLYHQVVLLRNAIVHEKRNYYGARKPVSLRNRTVILVDDVLASSDTMMACLRSIRKQSARKVVVAVPVVNEEAAKVIREEADDLLFLRMDASSGSPDDYFASFPRVDEEKVKDLLETSGNNSRNP